MEKQIPFPRIELFPRLATIGRFLGHFCVQMGHEPSFRESPLDAPVELINDWPDNGSNA